MCDYAAHILYHLSLNTKLPQAVIYKIFPYCEVSTCTCTVCCCISCMELCVTVFHKSTQERAALLENTVQMSLFLQVELSACHSKIKQEISAREKVEAQVLEVYTSLHSLSTPTYIHGLKIFQCNVNMKFPSSCGDIITLQPCSQALPTPAFSYCK